MSKITAIAFSLLLVGSVTARERPILSCDKAPLLAEFQKQLPNHILDASADTKPKLLSRIPRFAAPILRRANASLVCVVLVLDSHGNVQDASVSYPAGLALTPKEREQMLSMQWSSAIVAGQARESLVNMEIEFR